MIGAATKDAASRLRDHSGSAAAAQGAAVILCLLASTGSPEAVDLIGDALQKALAKRERRLPAATASALRMLSCVHVSAAAALGAPLRISKAAFAVLCDVPGEGGGQSGAALLEWADAAALAVCLLPSPDVPRVWEALSAAAAEASQAEDASQREAVILGAAVVALACRLRHLGAAAPSTTWREEGEGGDAAVADHESRLFEVVARAETGGSGTVTLLACCRAVEVRQPRGHGPPLAML